MGKLEDIVQALVKEYEIAFHEKLLDGHTGTPVFRAKRHGEAIVIKIGFGSSKVIQEVEQNIAGYKAMKKIGADSIIPRKLQFLNVLGSPVIIMEDLGFTFKDQSKVEDNPLIMFQNLIAGLKRVYQKTLVTGRLKGRGYEFLQEMKDLLLIQYRDYLLPNKLIDAKDLQLPRQIEIREFDSRRFCFGVWNFTPEDVFVKGENIYYIDPPPNVLGIPIIDLACFAGVSRDAYCLPGSKAGYELLHSFAINDVARMLNLGLDQAERIFLLGRSIQCSLSARFRIDSEPKRANTFAKQSVEFLKKMLKY